MSALPVNWVRHLGYFTPPWSSSWAPRDQTWSWRWSLKQTKHSCVFDFTFILGKLLFINHKLRAYHDVCVLWSNPSCSDLLRSLGLENDSLMHAAFELGFPQVHHFVPLLQNYKISSKRKEKCEEPWVQYGLSLQHDIQECWSILVLSPKYLLASDAPLCLGLKQTLHNRTWMWPDSNGWTFPQDSKKLSLYLQLTVRLRLQSHS